MYTFDSRIRYSETDFSGKLTMASLINYFQDASTFHSEEVGMGRAYMKKANLVWVLSAWQIVVDRYPEYGENVTIGTLPYDMKNFLGYRNFCMMDKEGNYIAKANTLWSLLNLETGRPVAVPEDMLAAYPLDEKLEMEYAPRRIAVPKDGERKEPVVVKKHHLDTNHHVNNQQFIAIAMEYLEEDYEVGQVRAEYKKQAFLDDVMTPYVACEDGKTVVTLEDEEGYPYVVVEFCESSKSGKV